VQVLNRDLSITMLRLFAERRLRDKVAKQLRKEGLSKEDVEARLSEMDWGARVREKPEEEGITILDALAATGLRSIRYMKEVPGVKEVVVNDKEEAAVEAAHRNVEYNKVEAGRVRPQLGDAMAVMYSHSDPPERQFDVIDLDPYGTASPFLDAAVQAVADGGMLCVTCTDMAVLNGNHPEVCWAKYRAVPTKGKYMHEMSVRIVLNALELAANRYRRYIQPVLSVAVDFYCRVFVRVFTSPAEVKNSMLKLSYVYQSVGSPSFYLQPVGRLVGNNYQGSVGPACPAECPETGQGFRVGGPIWSAPIHDLEWVAEALERLEAHDDYAPGGALALPTRDRLIGLLTSVTEELQDVPLFYTLPDICGTLHCSSPRMDDMKVRGLVAMVRLAG
jgi:tRNA (guanine26-N2/guanine27-N2)-dimethyltransferase